jgi:homogentisate 1,2-dioxygenase
MRSLRLHGFKTKPEKDHLAARKTMLVNSDCAIVLAAPQAKSVDYFYKNADCDEMIFVHKGSGTLRTFLGNIDFKYGDYLMIPRGMIYTMEFKDSDNRLFIVESHRPMYTPKRYRNYFGQLLEHSPFCERDIRRPKKLETHDEKGDFVIKVKKQNMLHELVYASHPFDVVGWDGYNYPYAFSIHDFEPITGRVHQPPPVHQTFETDAFVVCSFVPAPLRLPPAGHPRAVQPQQHRQRRGALLRGRRLHEPQRHRPGPHQPAPRRHPPRPAPRRHGAQHRQEVLEVTDELAVMVDTFKPDADGLSPRSALKIDDGKYDADEGPSRRHRGGASGHPAKNGMRRSFADLTPIELKRLRKQARKARSCEIVVINDYKLPAQVKNPDKEMEARMQQVIQFIMVQHTRPCPECSAANN